MDIDRHGNFEKVERAILLALLFLFLNNHVSFIHPAQSAESVDLPDKINILDGDSSMPIRNKKKNSPKSDSRESRPSLREDLLSLCEASCIYDTTHGGTNPVNQAFEKERARIDEKDCQSIESLHWILDNGTIAGRIYVAFLLKGYDTTAGELALDKLAKSDMAAGLVELKSARGSNHFTLLEILTDLRSAAPTIRLTM